VLEDRAVPAVSSVHQIAANGIVATNAATVSVNTQLVVGLQTTTQIGVQTGIQTAGQPFHPLTPIPPPLQTQVGQPGNSVLISTNAALSGGLLSPGVPTGFTGRIVFANTGTPQRVANGGGDFSPAAGVVPTGLYLNGGGDNSPTIQPVRPAPAASPLPMPQPLPGVFFQPDSGVIDLNADPNATAADLAVAGFVDKP
jgi:hypothetical protein